MAIDRYSLCPGGLGKKVKFCCPDLVTELDKVSKMLDGDQRVASLDYITKLEAKYQDRACLLALRSMVEASLDKRDDAAATLARFSEKFGDNPVALAEKASLMATSGNPVDAIPVILEALEASKESAPPAVYESLGTVALGLLDHGDMLPGLALLSLQLSMSRGEDERPARELSMILGDPSTPLLYKEPPAGLLSAPEGCTCKFEFDIALQKGRTLQWKMAADKFAALIPLAGQIPELWHNLGVLRTNLGDYVGAAEAWHKFASLSGETDDAIEAEAFAQMLDRNQPVDREDFVAMDFAVSDQNEMETRLASDKQLAQTMFDPRQFQTSEEDPPPRAGFIILDRPALSSVDGITPNDVPRQLGFALLYGRQTDRAERLQVIAHRSEFPTAEAALRRIAGELMGARTEKPELVLDSQHKVEKLLNVRWHLPQNAPPDVSRRLNAEQRRIQILETWPTLPLQQFNGQTLAQVAADPKQRYRALGHLLNWEFAIIRGAEPGLFNELRRKLGLPEPAPIDPTKVDNVETIPIIRMARVEADKLTDAQLIGLYNRAGALSAYRGMLNLGAEIIRRPSLEQSAQPETVLETLAIIADDQAQALRYIEQGRAIAHKHRHSTARWDLQELRLRLQAGEAKEAVELAVRIQKQHGQEPGVLDAVGQLLYQSGLIDVLRQQREAMQKSGPGLITPDAGEPGKLVLPGGEPAPAAGKSALWIPGQ